MGSDNLDGADNQQERPIGGHAIGILRGHTPDIRQRRMMRWSHLHGDMQERRDVDKGVLLAWQSPGKARAKFLVG